MVLRRQLSFASLMQSFAAAFEILSKKSSALSTSQPLSKYFPKKVPLSRLHSRFQNTFKKSSALSTSQRRTSQPPRHFSKKVTPHFAAPKTAKLRSPQDH
jgi:hypothetical protein